MTRKRVAVFGAIDRDNFGDLLFPLILESALLKPHEQELEAAYCGLVASDLSAIGAKPTKPVSGIFNRASFPDDSVLIVAGGEVLCCDWTAAHYYLAGKFSLPQRAVRKVFGKPAMEHLIRRKYGYDADLPFVVPRRLFSQNVRIAYNAVGGSNLRGKTDMLATVHADVADADYISVRDAATKELLTANPWAHRDAELVPDSAILMSQLFPVTALAGRTSPACAVHIGAFGAGNYFCLQVKQSLGRSHEQAIAAEVEKVYREFGLPCILLPIGRAFGHSDHVMLAALDRGIKTPHRLVEDSRVFDTMALIANAGIFAGTSLHGTITSIAYAVPHIALNNSDLKVPSFLESWDVPEQRSVPAFDGLVPAVKSTLAIPRDALLRNRDQVLAQARRGLEALAAGTGLPEPRFEAETSAHG
jgi:hypothetical protein